MTEICFAVTIDGPVAAGKTTVGRLVARDLDAIEFDTGLLYRAAARGVVLAGVDPNDASAVAEIARQTELTLRPSTVEDGRAHDILVNGEDVTWDLRTPEIDHILPPIAANPGVREAFVIEQRRIGREGRVVMIGRDIGTVILPDAEFKFFLDAPVDERARRRYGELRERGLDITYQTVLNDLEERDRVDKTRDISPLRPADDAVCIQTQGRSEEQVACLIVHAVKAGLAEGKGHPCPEGAQ